jgi:hypothetical protein
MAVALPYIMTAAAVAGTKVALDARKAQKRAEEAQTKNFAEQKQTLAQQEAVQVKQQSELAQEAQTRARAKRSGGLRSLLSGSELGLSGGDTTTTKLGGGM